MVLGARRFLNVLGWRFLARRKAALCAAVLTLALALGANTVVFSVLQAFLLSSYGIPDAGRLFVVAPIRDLPGRGSVVFAEAWPNYLLLRDATRSYEELAATLQVLASWDDGSTVRALQASRVTASFFATTRVPPILGRAFTEAEEGPTPAPVVVVGYDLWREYYGGDASIVGSRMSLDGVPHTVIGVMPRGFSQPLPTDIWLPFDIAEPQRRSITGARTLGVLGRLADDVTPAAAALELTEVDRRALAASPDNAGYRYELRTMLQVLLPQADRTVLLVQVGSGLLVLLAVLNLSTVLVAWGFERKRELAVRIALGAGDRSVTWLLVLQNLLVTVIGASVGLAISLAALPLLRAMDVGPTLSLFLDNLELDLGVLAVSAATAVGSGLLAGFVPARLAARGGLDASVRSGPRTSTLSPAAVRWQKGMVLSQVTLTVLLGSAAAFVGMSLRNLSAVDSGFVAGSKVIARVQMTRDEYTDHDARAAFAARLMDALALERALSSYAFTSTLPVGDGTWGARFFLDPADAATGTEPLLFHIRRTSANYHEVAGIPVLHGRAFERSDDGRNPKVAIVSESLATRLWPGEVALGKALYRLIPGNQPPERVEVVGVAADVIDAGASAPVGETVYVPYAQISVNRMSIVVDPRADGPAAVEAIRRALREADPLLAAAQVTTFASLERQANALPRLQTVLLVGFGLIATGIVALGCFGVMSQLVATRKKELAMRLVFGATPRGLGGSVLTQAAVVALPGILLGVVLVRLMSGVLQPFVFGVATGSLAVAAMVGAATLLVVALATLAPAAQAMRVDPRGATDG